MTRTQFQRDLDKLQDDLLVLGSMVSHALEAAMQALVRRDAEAARRIIAYDREVNRRKYGIEEECLMLIATQQPAARDLRLLAAILEISTELERIGDYAKGIGRITLYMGNAPLVKPLVTLPKMCAKAIDMLRRALDAFVNQDVESAQAIPLEDDELDAMYNQVNRELLDIIIADTSKIDGANYLTWVAHNLERAGDRVTNICERIIYTATGELVEFDADEPFLSGVN
ncbi:MAG: phosphate signaling complex protein PhoU [Litorilinea sp.]